MKSAIPKAAVAKAALPKTRKRTPRLAIAKVATFVMLGFTLLALTASPAFASTGATLAEAKPWHYWIAFVLLMSALGVVLIALPLGYYMRVWRLKHPRR